MSDDVFKNAIQTVEVNNPVQFKFSVTDEQRQKITNTNMTCTSQIQTSFKKLNVDQKKQWAEVGMFFMLVC